MRSESNVHIESAQATIKEISVPEILRTVMARPRPVLRFFTGRNMREAPAPLVVEIEVGTRCNRRCSYCPSGHPESTPPARLMPQAVFARILDQLSQCSFSGRLSYHLYNEPLLRKDLETLVSCADAALPDACQVIYTNGDLLSEKRYSTLIAAGTDHIVVTRHDSDSFPDRPRQTVLRPSDLNLTNRGGFLLDIAQALTLGCYAPAEMLIVAYNGDVLACYEDATREHVMGNLMEQDLADIWTSKAFTALRRSLNAANRAAASKTCARCNNTAHTEQGRVLFAL